MRVGEPGIEDVHAVDAVLQARMRGALRRGLLDVYESGHIECEHLVEHNTGSDVFLRYRASLSSVAAQIVISLYLMNEIFSSRFMT